jgi:hypothetical protein
MLVGYMLLVTYALHLCTYFEALMLYIFRGTYALHLSIDISMATKSDVSIYKYAMTHLIGTS